MHAPSLNCCESSVPSPANSRRRGFSLTELIVVIVVIGILTAGGAMLIPNLNQAANERLAIARAQALNAGKSAYLMRESTANQSWTTAANDQARFTLILPFLGNAVSGDQLTAYVPAGFSFALGTLDGRVTVTNTATNTVIPY